MSESVPNTLNETEELAQLKQAAAELSQRGDIEVSGNGFGVVEGINDDGSTSTKDFDTEAAAQDYRNTLVDATAAMEQQFNAPAFIETPIAPGKESRASRRARGELSGDFETDLSVRDITERLVSPEQPPARSIVGLAKGLPHISEVFNLTIPKAAETQKAPEQRPNVELDTTESPNNVGPEIAEQYQKGGLRGLWNKVRTSSAINLAENLWDKANAQTSLGISKVMDLVQDRRDRLQQQDDESTEVYVERMRVSNRNKLIGITVVAAAYGLGRLGLNIDHSLSSAESFNNLPPTGGAPSLGSGGPEFRRPGFAAGLTNEEQPPTGLRTGGFAFNQQPGIPEAQSTTLPNDERRDTYFSVADADLLDGNAGAPEVNNVYSDLMSKEWFANREGNDFGTALVGSELDGNAPAGLDDLVNERWAESPDQFASALTGFGLADGYPDTAEGINALSVELETNPEAYDNYRQQIEELLNQPTTSVGEAAITNPYSSEYLVADGNGGYTLAQDDYVDQGGTKFIVNFVDANGQNRSIEFRKECGGQRIVEQSTPPPVEAAPPAPYVPYVETPTAPIVPDKPVGLRPPSLFSPPLETVVPPPIPPASPEQLPPVVTPPTSEIPPVITPPIPGVPPVPENTPKDPNSDGYVDAGDGAGADVGTGNAPVAESGELTPDIPVEQEVVVDTPADGRDIGGGETAETPTDSSTAPVGSESGIIAEGTNNDTVDTPPDAPIESVPNDTGQTNGAISYNPFDQNDPNSPENIANREAAANN